MEILCGKAIQDGGQSTPWLFLYKLSDPPEMALVLDSGGYGCRALLDRSLDESAYRELFASIRTDKDFEKACERRRG